MTQQVGDPLPPGDFYGVSVYLPTWEDTLSWAQRKPEFLARLKTGYPRFFIPRVVLELASQVLKYTAKFGKNGLASSPLESQFTLVLPTYKVAEACQVYLRKVGSVHSQIILFKFSGQVTLVQGHIPPDDRLDRQLYAVTYPEAFYSDAKAFWQHTGAGISTRCAVYWLQHAPFLDNKKFAQGTPAQLPFEEGYRSMCLIRKRIADSLSSSFLPIKVEDVMLYPTGMSAISNTSLAVRTLHDRRSGLHRVAVFGFGYVDTLKVLSKIQGMECKLYGHGSLNDLNKLETDLNGGFLIDALYTEFPGNPLLQTPDLERLHQLSQKHGFVLVVDDTVGTAVNVSLFPHCDVICTSLTKMFSGNCNVMGGSATLNPRSSWYDRLELALSKQTPEPYFPLDAIVMEKNSQDFGDRVLKASANTEMVVDMLKDHPCVVEVFYPKGSASQHLYDKFRRTDGGYGFLVSVRFATPDAAIAFHDALDVAKGPSLGTNFTLCCAYTLLAHYSELDWAAEYGVIEHLVRISVGVESQAQLQGVVNKALEAAGNAIAA